MSEKNNQKTNNKKLGNKKEKQGTKAKHIVIISLITALILGLIIGVVINTGGQTSKAEELYQKDNVDPASVKALDDPNYQNIILSDELDKRIDEQEEIFVFFFSPRCKYCEESKADITKAFKEAGVDYYQFNLLEYKEGYNKYGVSGTPAIFHYKDGEVANTIYGSQPFENYKEWIESELE